MVTLNDGSALPSFITFVSNTITIYSTNFSGPPQTVTVKIVATEIFNSLSATATFDVTLNKCASSISTSTPFTSKTYTLGNVAINIPVTYVATPGSCPTNFSYLVTLNDGSVLPSFITFSSNTITIYSNDVTLMAGSYVVKIVATEAVNALTATDSFTVTINKCATSIETSGTFSS